MTAQGAAAAEPAYIVGDFVWALRGVNGTIRDLARIESAHPLRMADGLRWLVKLRRPSGWTSGADHRHVEAKLTPDELIKARRLQLIPRIGSVV